MTDEAPLRVTSRLAIPRQELELTFARSGGPGGQNVNKVSSKVLLRWPFELSPTLSPGQKAAIRERVPSRFVTAAGEILIAASEHRDQIRNKEAAFARFVVVVRQAFERPKTRIVTRPGRGARARRRDAKERQSDKKARRRDLD